MDHRASQHLHLQPGEYVIDHLPEGAAVVNPLAQAAIPVFVTSTYHADLVFVPAERRHEAAGTLRRAGHVVHETVGASPDSPHSPAP